MNYDNLTSKFLNIGYTKEFCKNLQKKAGGVFKSIPDIQYVLDSYRYKSDWKNNYQVESVSSLIERTELMCLDAAILSLGLLEVFEVEECGILAIHRKDRKGEECGHAITYYKLDRQYGGFAASNHSSLNSVNCIFSDVHSIAKHYAGEYVKMRFSPMCYGITPLQTFSHKSEWKHSDKPLSEIADNIMANYEYEFMVRVKNNECIY